MNADRRQCSDPLWRDACTDSLLTFAETMLPGYSASRVHRLLATRLEACFSRKIRRICVSMPPRCGKSQLSSVLFPAWALTKNPALQIMLASHSMELAERFSMEVRRLLSQERHVALFPPILSPELDRSRDWRTNDGGGLYATGVGAGGLGRGCSFLICDDLTKNREDAESATGREKLWDWLTSTALTRLTPDGVVIVIGSRWHEDDVIGRLTGPQYNGPKFEVINLEAICEHPESDLLGRKEGESIWPEQWTPAKFLETRDLIGRREFASHYQGRPTVSGGNLCDVAKVKVIDHSDIPSDLDLSRAWDLALGTAAHNDYSVGARGGMSKDGCLFLVDLNRRRRSWPEQKELIIAKAKAEGGRVGIEAVGGWAVAGEELREALSGVATVKNMQVSKSKEARATGWLSLIDAGKLYIVRAPWNTDFMHELEQFPNGTHDDQIDAVSLLYELVRKRDHLLFAVSEGWGPSFGHDLHGLRSWRTGLHGSVADQYFR